MDQLAWHHVHNEAYRRLGGVAAVNRIDNLKTGIAHGCGAWGQINEQYRVYARMMGFHVDACEVRAPEQKGKTERRVGDCKGLNVQDRRFDGLAGLQSWTDADRAERARKRICPATGLSVADTWEAEKPSLRPLPALLPEPFDLVRTAPVHKDCTVHFEGRSYVVPFTHSGREVEVRGCSGCVQVVDPLTATVLVSYPRHTQGSRSQARNVSPRSRSQARNMEDRRNPGNRSNHPYYLSILESCAWPVQVPCGTQLLPSLSARLKSDFGKGFDRSNLQHMRAFYLAYPKCDALRPELSWTHYRLHRQERGRRPLHPPRGEHPDLRLSLLALPAHRGGARRRGPEGEACHRADAESLGRERAMSHRWPMVPLNDVLKLQRRWIEAQPTETYRAIGIRSFGNGIFYKAPVRSRRRLSGCDPPAFGQAGFGGHEDLEDRPPVVPREVCERRSLVGA